jgi:hypothetical protein
MRRTAFLLAVVFLMVIPAPVFAAAASDEWQDESSNDRKNPVDVGAYVAVAAVVEAMDTNRLTAKIVGADPFPLYTPGLDFELHFFGHGAAIAGFSGGFWNTESKGSLLDTTLSGWDIKLDLGTPLAEYKLAVISLLLGLGYAENYMDLKGDFTALRNHDKDLPAGRDHVTLKQRGFDYSLALRADLRNPAWANENGAFLTVYGLSMGYKGVWATPWLRGNRKISNLPDVTEAMIFARVHIGFGGGAYLSNGDY